MGAAAGPSATVNIQNDKSRNEEVNRQPRGRQIRRKSIPSQKGGERKAGSIFRMRSESPVIDHRASRSVDDRSNHATCEDEDNTENLQIFGNPNGENQDNT